MSILSMLGISDDVEAGTMPVMVADMSDMTMVAALITISECAILSRLWWWLYVLQCPKWSFGAVKVKEAKRRSDLIQILWSVR